MCIRDRSPALLGALDETPRGRDSKVHGSPALLGASDETARFRIIGFSVYEKKDYETSVYGLLVYGSPALLGALDETPRGRDSKVYGSPALLGALDETPRFRIIGFSVYEKKDYETGPGISCQPFGEPTGSSSTVHGTFCTLT